MEGSKGVASKKSARDNAGYPVLEGRWPEGCFLII